MNILIFFITYTFRNCSEGIRESGFLKRLSMAGGVATAHITHYWLGKLQKATLTGPSEQLLIFLRNRDCEALNVSDHVFTKRKHDVMP